MKEEMHHGMPADFDPLLIGILGCFAGLFMVAAYHFAATRCRHPTRDTEEERQGNSPEPWRGGNSSLLPTYRHSGDCKMDGICAVCLSEFADGEMIRILPECLHSFHAQCIDMWLYSHTSCPLCRANTRLLPLPLPRRLAPSTSHSHEVLLPISSVQTTRQASEDASPRQMTVPIFHLDEDLRPGTLVSVTRDETIDDPLPRSPSSFTPRVNRDDN